MCDREKCNADDCVRILSEAVAGLPLHLYKYNSNGSKEKAV